MNNDEIKLLNGLKLSNRELFGATICVAIIVFE